MNFNSDILPNHSNHPGWDADSCPLRITIMAKTSSSDGFACSKTGGHCLPHKNPSACAEWIADIILINPETIENRLRFCVSKNLGISESLITREKTFAEMGGNIFDICDLVVDAENHFKIVLLHGHEFFQQHVANFGDLCDYIDSQTRD